MGNHCTAPCWAPGWLVDRTPIIRCKKPPGHPGVHKDRLWTSDSSYLYVEWEDGHGPHRVDVGSDAGVPGMVPC